MKPTTILFISIIALIAVCKGQHAGDGSMHVPVQVQQPGPQDPVIQQPTESHPPPPQFPQSERTQLFVPHHSHYHHQHQQMPVQGQPQQFQGQPGNNASSVMPVPVYYPVPGYQPYPYYPVPGYGVPIQPVPTSGNASYPTNPIPTQPNVAQQFVPPPMTTVIVGIPNPQQQFFPPGQFPPQPYPQQQQPFVQYAVGQYSVPPSFPVQNSSKPHYTVLGLLQEGFFDLDSNNCRRPYYGLIPDLLDAISNISDFTFSLALQPDGLYGYSDPTGRWKGLIGSVLEGKADFAAAPLRITREREAVIDFTLPFFHYTVGLLVNRDYSNNVNGNGVTYLVNAAGSNFEEFTAIANNSQHQHILDAINRNTSASYFNGTNKEAIEKVTNGPFAFITDSPNINLAVSHSNGTLERTKDVFSTGFYAFAVPNGSPLREKLNYGLLTLMRTGDYQRILNKYNL